MCRRFAVLRAYAVRFFVRAIAPVRIARVAARHHRPCRNALIARFDADLIVVTIEKSRYKTSRFGRE